MDDAQKRHPILYAVFSVICALRMAFVYEAPCGKPVPSKALRLLAGIVAIPTGFISLSLVF